jgi:hypothetical protein
MFVKNICFVFYGNSGAKPPDNYIKTESHNENNSKLTTISTGSWEARPSTKQETKRKENKPPKKQGKGAKQDYRLSSQRKIELKKVMLDYNKMTNNSILHRVFPGSNARRFVVEDVIVSFTL